MYVHVHAPCVPACLWNTWYSGAVIDDFGRVMSSPEKNSSLFTSSVIYSTSESTTLAAVLHITIAENSADKILYWHALFVG